MVKALEEAHESLEADVFNVVVSLPARLPFIPVACHRLAVVHEPTLVVTGSVDVVSGASYKSIVSVLFG